MHTIEDFRRVLGDQTVSIGPPEMAPDSVARTLRWVRESTAKSMSSSRPFDQEPARLFCSGGLSVCALSPPAAASDPFRLTEIPPWMDRRTKGEAA